MVLDLSFGLQKLQGNGNYYSERCCSGSGKTKRDTFDIILDGYN